MSADRAELVGRLGDACHQEVDEDVYDHPYVAELREVAGLAAAALAAPDRETLAQCYIAWQCSIGHNTTPGVARKFADFLLARLAGGADRG